MSAIDQYISRIPNAELQQQLRDEVERLTKKKRFGLVWENHLPDNVTLPEVRIRRGTKVALRDKTPNEVYEVQSLTDKEAVCVDLVSFEEVTLPLSDLIAVAQRGDVIYPYFQPMDSVQNAPDSDLWHTLIEADNYHALQLLVYLYAGQVDCIYIDPPYNKPDSHDWKYNCDYVDGTDSYRHSKWLSMLEARLKIAKKLLNPNGSVLIVTIDEMEYHHLGCLLEQLFPEANIQMVTTVINAKGVARINQFSRVEEYIYIIEIGNAIPSAINDSMLDFEITGNYKQNVGGTIPWSRMLRRGSNSHREHSENCFYPIFVNEIKGVIDSVGFPPGKGISRNEAIIPNDCVAVWPMHEDSEGCWQLSRNTFLEALDKGTAKLGRKNKLGQWSINYLNKGLLNEISNGSVIITGKDEKGAVILQRKADKLISAKSVWTRKSHDASLYGSVLLSSIIGKRFSYPKSLYAVHDVLRFFVANKPNALILDFFAGSGTTLHAVNLLNKEDGGNRRCIMVTNNEIGEPKEKELWPQGFRPGDEEWERWGIARYVNWPRTKCSILGEDVNGQPIEGNYITSLTQTKEIERKFTQINFLPSSASLKQKKSLVTLINKQKAVKLPIMTLDEAFLVSEDDSYNASILFDVTKTDEWLEALEGNDHITNFYIVAEKDATYKQVKNEVSEMMGKIEETLSVEMPMKDGFKANAIFFKLGFLDKRSVERGRQLQELLPLLWMKAGAKGLCPKKVGSDYSIWPENHMALLTNEACFPRFRDEIVKHKEVEMVYIITDSQTAYLNMRAELKGKNTCQLYRDYVENFKINYATK